jgi:predicted nucleotidyltransferase
MNYTEVGSTHERAEKTKYKMSAVESFFDDQEMFQTWPESITSNEDFLSQIEFRKELQQRFEQITSKLPKPNISLESGIKMKLLSENEVSEFYTLLINLLESDQDYERIILYIPFEFLPDISWQPETQELVNKIEQFKKVYIKYWEKLLSMQDVRANFVDGDVMDKEYQNGDFPRVVKAAHLITILVQKGFFDIKYVLELIQKSANQTLKQSINDTLPVLTDLGFYPQKTEDIQENKEPKLTAVNLSLIQEFLHKKFTEIDNNEYSQTTEKRMIWLKQKNKLEVVEICEQIIAESIESGSFTDGDLQEFMGSKSDTTSKQAFIGGIRKAIENNPEKAQTLYKHYQEDLLTLWKSEVPEIKEALTKTFYHLRSLGIIDDDQLNELNIVMPKLAGPFSENIKTIEDDIQKIKNSVTSIESNPKLSELIYPTVIMFGSRIKGYGTTNSDTDIGVFVKPGISFKKHTELQEQLKNIFTQEKIHGEIIEFWLEENDDQLNIKDFENPDSTIGESYWTHVLFGSVWEGNPTTIKELHDKLLAQYMYDNKREINGENSRSVYLGEIERDVLQYRLMHKGYERFYPHLGGINTLHSDNIDGKSMFWDSGYRQLATKLFINKVFLPKLSVIKK